MSSSSFIRASTGVREVTSSVSSSSRTGCFSASNKRHLYFLLAGRDAGSVFIRLPDDVAGCARAAPLQSFQHLFGAFYHFLRDARHTRHLYAVTPIRAARNQFAQPDDTVALLLNGNTVVLHGREMLCQFVEMVVVRGEQGFAADARQVFRNRPRDGKAVICAGSPPDFIQIRPGCVAWRC